jgi:hypothetical protein
MAAAAQSQLARRQGDSDGRGETSQFANHLSDPSFTVGTAEARPGFLVA